MSTETTFHTKESINIVLEGVETLRIETVRKNEVDKVVVKSKSFTLVAVTPSELAKYRESGVPSFVLKVDGKLYHSRIPKKSNFLGASFLGKHQCAAPKMECKHLTAAMDEDGGCAKVRNKSKNIENYSWIKTGYETFNTKCDCFVVVDCSHYEQCELKKISVEESNRAKVGLAQFIWADVTTRAEVTKRIAANKKNKWD